MREQIHGGQRSLRDTVDLGVIIETGGRGQPVRKFEIGSRYALHQFSQFRLEFHCADGNDRRPSDRQSVPVVQGDWDQGISRTWTENPREDAALNPELLTCSEGEVRSINHL